jgi:hypothetical protein
MCWAHHFWPALILSLFFPSRLYLDATAWRKFLFCIFPSPWGGGCDPERLTASSIYTMLSFFSIFTGIPRLIRVQFCFFHILSFKVNGLAYINAISVAKHTFLERS